MAPVTPHIGAPTRSIDGGALYIPVGLDQGRERMMWYLPVQCGRGYNRRARLKKMARPFVSIVVIPGWERMHGALSTEDRDRIEREAVATIMEIGTRPLSSYMRMVLGAA